MQYLADLPPAPSGAPVDLTGYVKTTDLGNYATKEDLTKKSEITALFDPLPTPVPLAQQPTIANLGSVVANVVGTQMVNGGKVNNFGRTSTPPQLTWDSTFNISPASTPCKLRFAVANSRQSLTGGVEVSINGAAPLTASNTASAWSSSNQALVAYQDGAWTWFEVAIPAQAAVIPVRVQLPTGQGAIPTLYAADAITSLKPINPTALVLRAFPDGQEMVFRPGELAKKSELPNLIPLADRVTQLEKGTFTKVADVSWFNTNFDTKYTRKVIRSTATSLTLEYKQTDGTVRQFSLNDFVTGFANSGYWNGAGDPNGQTRFVAGTETVVVSWDGTGENLTLAVPKGAGFLQIRKVRVNGQPLDWFPIYEPTA